MNSKSLHHGRPGAVAEAERRTRELWARQRAEWRWQQQWEEMSPERKETLKKGDQRELQGFGKRELKQIQREEGVFKFPTPNRPSWFQNKTPISSSWHWTLLSPDNLTGVRKKGKKADAAWDKEQWRKKRPKGGKREVCEP